MSIQQFCLRWNNHQPNFISVFTTLLNNESLVDVTLAAEGKHLQAHKVVLSACSVYFQTLFTANPSRHPIVILKDVKYADLRIMVDFMYYGEVNVSQEQLPQILETAKMLKIKGLTEMPDSTSLTKAQSTSSERADLLTPGESSWGSDTQQRHSISPCNLSPSMKRKRLRKTSTGSGSTSIEKSAEDKHFIDHSATLNLVKTDSITLSSVPQHSVKIKTKELQYSDFQTSKESLDENGGVDNSISLNTDESNCLMRGVEPALDDPAANLSQQGQREKLMNKRGKLLIRQHRIQKGSEYMASTPDEEASTSEFVSSIIQRQVSEPILPSVKAMHLSRGNYVKKQYSHSTPYSHMQNTIKFCGVNAGASLLPFSIILESNDILPSCTSSAVNLVKESVICDVDPPATSSEAPSGREQPTIENVDNTRSSHCPVIRPGPSLSCNYCWNTVDDQGRILRRKTKYHCPECQVNLCIVPCFHEYHERNVT